MINKVCMDEVISYLKWTSARYGWVPGHIKTDTKRLFTYICNRDKLSISSMKLKKVFLKRLQKK